MELGAPITSRANARVKALRASFSGEARRPGELVGVEGENLLAEALRSGVPVQAVFVREGSEALLDRPSLLDLVTPELLVLQAEVYASAVDTASPQGIAAMVRIPQLRARERQVRGAVLVLEEIQDPGNLGTLLRSAEAFAVPQVYVTRGTANPWNPKAMRASAGSVFRMAVERAELAEIHASLRAQGARLIAATARTEEAVPLHRADLEGPCALLIGNEGRGLSEAALALAEERVHIPCYVESLNAAIAGSTLLYEAFRQNLLLEAQEPHTPGALR